MSFFRSHSSVFVHNFIPSPDPVEHIVYRDEEEVTASYTALMETRCKEVQIQGLTLSDYRWKVYVYVNQVVDPGYKLRDGREKHSHQIAYSVRRIGSHYSHRLISVFFYSVVKLLSMAV